MMSVRNSSWPALAVLIALTCAAPAMAQKAVPFKGSLDGEIVAVNGNTLTADDRGEITHLGQFTAVQTYVFGSATDFAGSIVLVAANGDMLFGTFEGVNTPDGVLMGDFTLDGGTGRFSSATGGGRFEGIDNGDDTFSLELDGTISYKASDGGL